MASLRARLVYDVLMPLRGGKRRYDPALTADALRAAERAAAPPPESNASVRVEMREIAGRPVYRLAPALGVPRGMLFYLHGGAFVNPITAYHWRFLADLCRRLRVEIRVPLYPLAPGTPIGDMTPVIEVIHDEVAGGAPCTLMGDSAGAYLTLALAQRLRDRSGPGGLIPAMVLISPCLDLALSDPRSERINRRDPMLDRAGIGQVLALAAAPWAVTDPKLDLLATGMEGLPPILALAGSRDILHPDTLRLAQAVGAVQGRIDVFEGDGMAHVWPLLPVPEAETARRAIVHFLQQHGDLVGGDG